MPFRFRRTSWSPSERSVSSEHWHDCSLTPGDRRHYCFLGESNTGRWRRWPPPASHVWGGCLNTDILQKAWPEDWITEAMLLSPGEAILFFSRHSRNEALPYCRVRNIKFRLGGPFNWVRRPTQIEASKTMQGRLLHQYWGCSREENEGQRAQDSHRVRQSPSRLQMWPMTSKSGCEAWREPLMGSQNEMMIWTAELINGTFTCSGGSKVKWAIGGRELQGFLGNLWEAHPLWKETVWIDRVNEVCNIQTRWGFLRRVADQGRQEKASR